MMMYSKILALLFLPLVLGGCKKDDDPYKDMPYNFSAVDEFVDNNLAVYQNKVVILVSQHGQIIYRKEVNMRPETQVPIASASKWLSAAVIMSLADEKRLSLDDSVGRFLPIFSSHKKGHITIRQLFSHTSGFAGDGDGSDTADKYEYSRKLTLAQAVDSIAIHTPLVTAPGTVFSYGSASMHIAGRIAEVAGGKPWQELFDERIGRPCNMQAPYFLTGENPLIAGGVRTSAGDYLHFVEMIAAGGVFNGRRVLSEQAIREMTSDQTSGARIVGTPYPANPFSRYNNKDLRYGMGNWLDVVDLSGNVLETSSPGLLGAHPWQDKKNKVSGVIFTRTAPKISQATSLKIRQMIRDIIEAKGT